MNKTLEDLKSRRSCRAYTAQQVSKEELNQVLEAGMYAPTGMGRQSPIMVAVQDPDTVRELSRLNARVMGSSTDPFYGAPTVIVVLADPEIGTYREDGSLVMGNLLNAAHAVGLGSCWIHRAREVFDSPEGKALLKKWGVPEKYVGIGNCILGYAAQPAAAPKPRKADYIFRV